MATLTKSPGKSQAVRGAMDSYMHTEAEGGKKSSGSQIPFRTNWSANRPPDSLFIVRSDGVLMCKNDCSNQDKVVDVVPQLRMGTAKVNAVTVFTEIGYSYSKLEPFTFGLQLGDNAIIFGGAGNSPHTSAGTVRVDGIGGHPERSIGFVPSEDANGRPVMHGWRVTAFKDGRMKYVFTDGLLGRRHVETFVAPESFFSSQEKKIKPIGLVRFHPGPASATADMRDRYSNTLVTYFGNIRIYPGEWDEEADAIQAATKEEKEVSPSSRSMQGRSPVADEVQRIIGENEVNAADYVDDNFRRRFKEAFAFFDQDRDGLLNFDEVGTAIRACGFAPSYKDLLAIMKSADITKRGTVKYHEILAALKPVINVTPEEHDKELCDALKEFDVMRSGTIDKAELKKYLTSIGEPLAPEEVEEVFRDLDASQARKGAVVPDGTLDYANFSRMLCFDGDLAKLT